MKPSLLVLANASGGLFGFRELLLSELSKSFDVYAATPVNLKKDELESIGVKLIDITMGRRSKNPFGELLIIFQYFFLIKKIKPQLIISYTIKPNIYGGIISRLFRVPFAANITGLGSAFQTDNYFKKIIVRLYRLALKDAKTVFFENAGNMSVFLNNRIIAPEQACLLNGAGVDLKKFKYLPYPESSKPYRFLFIGRVMKEKGVNELFNASKQLHDDGFDLVLDIVGGCEEDYTELLKQYESEGWLHYHGYQDDVVPFIQNCHCFVLPSWHEGMANTNLECAASGRPVITTNIPGCKEAVIDGLNGYLCEPKNVKSLYSYMKTVLNLDRETLMTMGLRGRRHMEKVFDKRIVVKTTIDALNCY